MARKVRVMLVEDNPEYRRVIEFALERDEKFDLVGNVGTVERALDNIHHMSDSEIPDLLLLDLNLPGMSGLESIPLFLESSPDLKIIILTQSDSEADVLNAISQGASGYLLKSSTVPQIKEGIQTVIDGGASLDPKVASFILTTLQDKLPKGELDSLLTDRELEVLSLLGDGKSKKEIAQNLDVSFFTVAAHIRNIYDKMNVANAPAAITKAYKTGIFPSGKSN